MVGGAEIAVVRDGVSGHLWSHHQRRLAASGHERFKGLVVLPAHDSLLGDPRSLEEGLVHQPAPLRLRLVVGGVVIDREVDLGRDPVDFKFSAGYANRALLEVKKLHNGKFWNGLEHQLTSYLKSDKCDVGRYLAIQYREHGRKTAVGQRKLLLPKRTADLAMKLGLDLKSTRVDARKKLSASKITGTTPT